MARQPAKPRPRPAKRERKASAVERGQLARVLNRPAMEGASRSAPVPVEPSPDNAVRLLALRPRHCRWPVGEAIGASQLFCGAAKEPEVSYCPWHDRASRASNTSNADRVLRGLANGQPLAR